MKLEKLLEAGGIRKDIAFLGISGTALLVSIFFPESLPVDAAWIAILLCGIPIILEAVIGLVTEFDIKADVLVSIALIASVIIGETFAAGEVAFIMQLGGLLEELTVARAQAGIEKLVHLTPRTARIMSEGGEKIVPAEQVAVGDLLRVLPGETVPVDGVIVNGQTSINQAVMTGESLPVDKTKGDEVSSGTVNQFGAFEMRATRVGEDSSIQRMIRLVRSADAGKAKIVGMADRWATWIVVIALTAAVLTFLLTHEILRSVTILVVFCPCAMVLATPTAIVAAIGNATKHGFLVREGDALERLAKVDKVAFDKTGTLTRGVPKVVSVRNFTEALSEKEMYIRTAAAESYSEHPLGKAVVSGCRELYSEEAPKAEDFQMVPGQGIRAKVSGQTLCAGNLKMMSEVGAWSEEGYPLGIASAAQEKRLAETYLRKGATLIYVAVDGKPAGFLALADTVRDSAKGLMEEISSFGIAPVLLTGDRREAGEYIAGQVGIREVHVECLPEDKLLFIEEAQKEGHAVCMVGDGINDAPALKKAFVGIAMGGVGSDIAVEAADIALVNDEIRELPHLLGLAKRMMFTIKGNLTFSMTLNCIAIILAVTGILNPVAGALVHNSGSVVVIINSALLLNWKRKK